MSDLSNLPLTPYDLALLLIACNIDVEPFLFAQFLIVGTTMRPLIALRVTYQ